MNTPSRLEADANPCVHTIMVAVAPAVFFLASMTAQIAMGNNSRSIDSGRACKVPSTKLHDAIKANPVNNAAFDPAYFHMIQSVAKNVNGMKRHSRICNPR